MKILDTDVCIEILRGNEDVIQRCAATRSDVATTFMTAGELYYGASKSDSSTQRRITVDDFLTTLPVLNMTPASAKHFGRLKARLETDGERLADADLLIASITLTRGGVVVTGNVSHYNRIPDVDIEDWIRSNG